MSIVSSEPNKSLKTRLFFFRPAGILTIVVFLAGSIAYPYCGPGISLAGGIFVSCALAFSCMTGVWCGVGKNGWRYVVATFAMLVTGIAMGTATSSRFEWLGVAIIAVTTLCVAMTLQFAKFFFGTFTTLTVLDDRKGDGLQFGIGQMMLVTAAVAVFVSLLQWVPDRFSNAISLQTEWEVTLIVLTIICVLVFNTLALTWSLMGQKTGWKLAATTLMSCCLTPVGARMAPTPDSYWIWVTFFSYSWMTIATQLFFLRLEGMRFLRV